MRYKSTYELLIPVIASINKTFTIDSILELTAPDAGVDGVWKLLSCNTLWATESFTVTIDDVDYIISANDPNISITITGPSAPTATTFQLYPPVFYHGTVKATESDLEAKINDRLLSTDRLPMIWLHEPTDETIEENPLRAIALTSRAELYFMTDADFAAWSNDDHYKLAIRPMRNLIESFMNAVNSATTINNNKITTSTPTDLPRFSQYTGKDGKDKTIFSRTLSGCKFEIELPFIRSNKICC